MKTKRVTFNTSPSPRGVHTCRITFLVVLVLCIMIVAAVFQPSITTHHLAKEQRLEKERFSVSKQGREPEMTIDFILCQRNQSLNQDWGLGFDIRSSDQRRMYIWLYHDHDDPDTQDPMDSLWMTCQADESTDGMGVVRAGAWEAQNFRYLKIKITLNTVVVYPNPVENITQAYSKECDMSEDFYNHTLHIECSPPSSQSPCPSVILGNKKEPAFLLSIVLNIGAFASVGCVLGLALAYLWIQHININIILIFLPGVKVKEIVTGRE